MPSEASPLVSRSGSAGDGGEHRPASRFLGFRAPSFTEWCGIALVAYLIVGMTVYHLLEGWGFPLAFYFCIVTLTTVGYGDYVPLSPSAKAFTVLYVITSISAIATIISYLIESLVDRNAENIENALRVEDRQSSNDRDKSYFSEAKLWLGVFIIVFIVGLLYFIFFQHLCFVDALYLVTITSSTVGFGDLHAKHNHGAMIFTAVWLLTSTISLAKDRRMKQIMQKSMRSQSDFEVIDTDNDDRVSRLEWLQSMLVRTEAVDQSTIDTIMARFDELDTDGSGYVEHDKLNEKSEFR